MKNLTINAQVDNNNSSTYLESIQMQNEHDIKLMKLKHEERNDAFKIALTVIGMGILIGMIYLIT